MADEELSARELAGRIQALEFLMTMVWANSLAVRSPDDAAAQVAGIVSDFSAIEGTTPEGRQRIERLGTLALAWAREEDAG